MKVIKTPKGTELQILDLRGKPYLQGAHRLVWINEEVPNFTINTEFLLLTDDQTIARTTLTLLDKEGKMIKQATATKRETKKDFSDHTEKAETAAVGRALAMLGFGTQHALSDLDEGARIVDSPLTDTRQAKAAVASPKTTEAAPASAATPAASAAEAPKPRASFRKPPKAAEGTTASGNTQVASASNGSSSLDDLGL